MNEKVKQVLNKIPEVTIIFWVIKIMGTTIGETAADFLSYNMNLGLNITSIIMGILLVITLFVQIRSKKYIPWMYRLSVVLISIVGTLITDNLVEIHGIALQTTTIIFSICLVATFVIRYLKEKTLSITSITSRKREIFYRLAILFTFALGTAGGDLMSEGLNLGYLVAALIFAGAIGLIAIGFYRFKRNAVVSFWMVYILTRPLGASFGDLFTQAPADGGLGISIFTVNAVCLLLIFGSVIYLTVKQKKEAAMLNIEKI